MIRKYGTGQILPKEEQDKLTKTAAEKTPDWTEKDDEELAQENEH